MRQGILGQQPQAQLDGFKSRALRAEAPTQRHLYTTEWRQVEVAGGVSHAVEAASVRRRDGGRRACEGQGLPALRRELWAVGGPPPR